MGSSPSLEARWRRGLATLLPALMPMTMKVVFGATTRRFGPQRGYQAAFAVYWALCWAGAGGIVGRRRLAELWRRPERALPPPRALAATTLIVPPLGAFATQWLPTVRASGSRGAVVAAGIGITNAMAEEALWRGVPAAIFPDDPVRGWLWPAVGFTAWHLAPLSARRSSPGRQASLLFGAAVIGVAHGWIVQRTGSLALVAPVHAFTDSCGLRPTREIWLRRRS